MSEMQVSMARIAICRAWRRIEMLVCYLGGGFVVVVCRDMVIVCVRKGIGSPGGLFVSASLSLKK